MKLQTVAASFSLPKTAVLTPLACAIALLGLSVAHNSHAQLRGDFFTQQNAALQQQQRAAHQAARAAQHSLDTQQQQAAARAQLSHSLDNLNRTASAIAAQQAAQNAARLAAQQQASNVAEGLAQGGLEVAVGDKAQWLGAEAPVHTQQNGQHHVGIKQTDSKAILNWNRFDVGRNTTVEFQQKNTDAVLNRVVGDQVAPSQIQGTIKGDGTVIVVNQNGIVFSGTSQVNVRNLVAAAAQINDEQFLKFGLYSSDNKTAAFNQASGMVEIERGAQIHTHAPDKSTAGGGYVLVMAKEIKQEGVLTAQKGQVTLAAGDSFIIRKGQGTDGNPQSLVRGNEVMPSGQGGIENKGLLQSRAGDISLNANSIKHSGVIFNTTTQSQRGTVNLVATGENAKVDLMGHSVTAIEAEIGGQALDSQRDTLLAPVIDLGDQAVVRADAFRRDLSLIKLHSDADIEFAANSLTLAIGGQVVVHAEQRSLVREKAIIDVAGALGVVLGMHINNIEINVQGFEQRDSPNNRDSKNLNNQNIWLDRRSLLHVAAGTYGYESDRWYTQGGLLEVGGYLGTVGRSTAEWLAQGGDVHFSGGNVVLQSGSVLNLSGGTLNVQSGFLRQSWLLAEDDRIHSADRAPGNLLYKQGLFEGYKQTSTRWGANRLFVSPLLAAQQRYESGYTLGRDAGRLIISTKNAVLDGEIINAIYVGEKQNTKHNIHFLDLARSYQSVPRKGQLILGTYTPYYVKKSGALLYELNASENTAREVVITDRVMSSSETSALETQSDADPEGVVYLSAAQLNSFELAQIMVATKNRIAVEHELRAAAGGNITLYSPMVDIQAGLTAMGGHLSIGNVLHQVRGQGRVEDTIIKSSQSDDASVRVAQGAVLNANGVSGIIQNEASNKIAQYLIDGGTVSVRSSGEVELVQGSTITVDSGVQRLFNGTYIGGKGGDIQLEAGVQGIGANLILDGELQGYGITGAGTLQIASGYSVVISDESLFKVKGVVQAGESINIPLTLLHDHTVLKGESLPADIVLTRTETHLIEPGGIVNTAFILTEPLTLHADFVVPKLPGTQRWVGLVGGKAIQYRSGQIVPAGTQINKGGLIPVGMTVAADVFPQGLQLPATEVKYTYKAGSEAPEDIHLSAGTYLAAGATFKQDVSVKPLLELPVSLFQKGFADYSVTGATGILVTGDTQLNVFRPVYQLPHNRDKFSLETLLTEPLHLMLPALHQEDPSLRLLRQRDGASLRLQAGTIASDAVAPALNISESAAIRVDPGQAIKLQGTHQITIDGALQAWGGNISVLQGYPGKTFEGEVYIGGDDGYSIWIGKTATLDVAARPFVAIDRWGRRYGQVSAGGDITLGGTIDHSTRDATLPVPFVVVREGAYLDASGTQAELDFMGQETRTVASHGGSISLASLAGLYIDGDLQARAGGTGAAGGHLMLAAGIRIANSQTSDRLRNVYEFVISQEKGNDSLPYGLSPQTAKETLVYGHAGIGVNQVERGGFDSLSILTKGMIGFDGDVQMSLGRQINVYAGSLGLAESVSSTGNVHISAPYITLAASAVPGRPDQPGWSYMGMHYGTSAFPVSSLPALGHLRLHASKALRIAAGAGLGGGGNLVLAQQDGTTRDIQRRAFQHTEILSQGDISLESGSLLVPGDLTLEAAQIYPNTAADASIHAGWKGAGKQHDPNRRLVIRQSVGEIAPLPYSVFGRLALVAAVIDQGGTVRAPMGSITLGYENGGTLHTDKVKLLAGSVTSVSANGLHMPYGGTVDGQVWSYNGQNVPLLAVGTGRTVGLKLYGSSVSVELGATVDLSGGGVLSGAGFISGRGGSTDARFNPLLQYSTSGLRIPNRGDNPVYAIVPTAYSAIVPNSAETGVADSVWGQQVTLNGEIPGLPKGTYALLPATYALLPGAYRLEINGMAGKGGGSPTRYMRNGSWVTSGVLSIAGTTVLDSLQSQFIVTPATALRRYSQYNETTYSNFVRADAARLGISRGLIEADAKMMELFLQSSPHGDIGFKFAGTVLGEAAEGGLGSTLSLATPSYSHLELLADGTTGDNASIQVYASDLSAVQVNRLLIGGSPTMVYGQGGNYIDFGPLHPPASITLRSGASLSAGEVMLITRQWHDQPAGIQIEQGATINTIGQGQAVFGSDDGFIYLAADKSVLSVSNARQQWLAPKKADRNGPGYIRLGSCSKGGCLNETSIYSEGSLVFATDADFDLGDKVRYGARHLVLAVESFNFGTPSALASASAEKRLSPGLTLKEPVVQRLLQGDISTGAPALETLELIADQSMNFYESVTLSTYGADGRSLLKSLLLTTPAIYGLGTGDDVAVIKTENLVWNGSQSRPAAVIIDGAGTGSGSLLIDTQRIEFGYGPATQPVAQESLARLVLGFETVVLNASERISANHRGSLQVYKREDVSGGEQSKRYVGGNLSLNTPLLTGESGSVHQITAGGAVVISETSMTPIAAVVVEGLGADLGIEANTIHVDSTLRLPSGKLTLTATDSLVLGEHSIIDLAGRKIDFFSDHDSTQYTWGGDLYLESKAGNISQRPGSFVDFSAQNNHAGRLTAIALKEEAGQIDLLGTIKGGTSGYYSAAGVSLPYKSGGVDIRAQRLGNSSDTSKGFAEFNDLLNDGQVFEMRHFQLKQGDLLIGNELRASNINVSVDDGYLSVNGLIDASGKRAGNIRLAAKHGLTIGSSAILDAHSTQIRLDTYGQVIEAANRGTIELNSGTGRLSLLEGAVIDLRYGVEESALLPYAGNALGRLELYAPRLGGATFGDIDIAIGPQLKILGARSIAVNAMHRYRDADFGADKAASDRPYQLIDQAYLNLKHLDSATFISAALANHDLLNNKLAGLQVKPYVSAIHLRPGVEIVSATPNGDLIINGDLDLSAHRYASLNPNVQLSSIDGSGEVGVLIIRAGGNLDIFGSINDGFSPPPETPDDHGWVLTPGYNAYGGNVIVPEVGVILAQGTQFAAGKTLNYDLPIVSTRFDVGTELPLESVLAAPMTLPANRVLYAPIYNVAGELLYAAGSIIDKAVTLPENTILGAGTVLPTTALLKSMVWPKGKPLPVSLELSSDIALPRGAVIPSETLVKLPDNAISTPLRPSMDNRQARNWAVAPMLPEGSRSWTMRLIAGADTQAADTRLVKQPSADGSLTLADAHYSVFTDYENLLFWAPGNWLGGSPGAPVEESKLPSCVSYPNQCVTATQVWAEDNLLGKTAGHAVNPTEIALCVDNPGACLELQPKLNEAYPVTQLFSVLRTGTGDLELLSANNIAVESPFGIYTSGTSTASRAGSASQAYDRRRSKEEDGSYLGTTTGSDPIISAGYEAIVNEGIHSIYSAWYPDHGGDLIVRAGGNLTGDMISKHKPSGLNRELRGQRSSANISNWLWRQGSGDTAGIETIETSWWINFGTYVKGSPRTNGYYVQKIDAIPELIGFTGFGTLGGGNLLVDVAGSAGLIEPKGRSATVSPRSQGLVLTVGSTGRVLSDGDILLTGGGDMTLRIGGYFNPSLEARTLGGVDNINRNGVLTNLRGELDLFSGAVGGLRLKYGSLAYDHDIAETRPYSPFSSTSAVASGGPVLMLGDATATLNTRGDLVLSGTGDPGRVVSPISHAFTFSDGWTQEQGGVSWFSLWTENTAINLFSAGGNLAPSTQLTDINSSFSTPNPAYGDNYSTTDGRFVYPSQLGVVATAGNIYMGPSIAARPNDTLLNYSLLLAPSPKGRLHLLAGHSIYGGGYAISRSGADVNSLATPINPAFFFTDHEAILLSNQGSEGISLNYDAPMYPIFSFGPNHNHEPRVGSTAINRIYARKGDIVGVRTGNIIEFKSGRKIGEKWYEAEGALWMRAGRDIVNTGDALGQFQNMPQDIGSYYQVLFGFLFDRVIGNGQMSGNLITHTNPNDVSIISAGRDIIQSSYKIAGPGVLEMTAGRHILMLDRATVTSLGSLHSDQSGASIVLQAGLGEQGADFHGYADFIKRYLSPANLGASHISFSEQTDKVIKTYQNELLAWLKKRYGFEANSDTTSVDEALMFFKRLPSEQQRIFVRDIYFAELREGGREYNNPTSIRFGSYLRGRRAIQSLFPDQGAQQQPMVYNGDILLFGGAGVHTNQGGDIQMLAPGGSLTFGVEGPQPPSTAGLITRGQGNIQLYSLDSILMGQSRIMTTFGGDILAWSAQGDINAGRGAKTTQVFTPPRRVYDDIGNVTISPDVPSTGAGIATLAPIAEVPPGDMDLIAPLGTIDAGEAGIRVSGNVNLAALHVVNAENIQVQGESKGMPIAVSVNVGALTSASSAASSAATAAQETLSRARDAARSNQPSQIQVQILGFGAGEISSATPAPSSSVSQQAAVRLLGRGALSPSQASLLTADERMSLGL